MACSFSAAVLAASEAFACPDVHVRTAAKKSARMPFPPPSTQNVRGKQPANGGSRFFEIIKKFFKKLTFRGSYARAHSL